MKWDSSKRSSARRASLVFFCSLVFAVGAVFSSAYTTAQFVPVQAQIENDIAILLGNPNPTRADRALLRSLQRASNVLTKASVSDGKTLRSLNSILGRNQDYAPALTVIASNLLTGFNAEYVFVGDFLQELPPSKEADVVKAQYSRFAPTAARLNAAAANLSRFAGLYDSAKSKLDSIFIRANDSLIIPFPSDLLENSVSAKIDGINFRASNGSSSERTFSAVATETNINVLLSVVANSGDSPRGILFAIPNAPIGSFRFAIPATATFTNRTGVYAVNENSVGATEGNIFMSSTPTEVYGSFSCKGPDFTITDGRFRITISGP